MERTPSPTITSDSDGGADLEALAEELGGNYEIEWFSIERTKEEFSLFKEESVELKVRADTLRAVLYQKGRAPFTPRDLELRETLLRWYPWKRISPMPLLFGTEPKFEIAEQ